MRGREIRLQPDFTKGEEGDYPSFTLTWVVATDGDWILRTDSSRRGDVDLPRVLYPDNQPTQPSPSILDYWRQPDCSGHFAGSLVLLLNTVQIHIVEDLLLDEAIVEYFSWGKPNLYLPLCFFYIFRAMK